MTELELFKTYPIGSILIRPDSEDTHYLQQITALTPGLKSLIASPTTSAFIRGLTKTYDVPPDKNPWVAFVVLQIACGEKTLTQLPNLLSTELQLVNNKAQQMAQEIEKELFVPVMLELNQYLAQQKTPRRSASSVGQAATGTAPSATAAGGAHNVLDLKSQPRPPLPPPIPRR